MGLLILESIEYLGYVLDSVEDARLNLEDLISIDTDLEDFARDRDAELRSIASVIRDEMRRLGHVFPVPVIKSLKFPLESSE